MDDIYRQSQIDKLSSPDKVDKTVEITSASFWIAIAGGLLIILVALIWSLVGTIPQKVEAQGVFSMDTDAYTLSSEVNGIVEKMMIESGDYVEVGDILYTLDTESLEKEKKKLEERRNIADAVTLSSSGDVSNSDTKQLLEIKSQIETAGVQVSQNEIQLEMREKELEQQKAITAAAMAKMTDARHVAENYQIQNSDTEEHYKTLKEAWSKIISYQASLEASQDAMQETKDELDYYSYYAESSDPEERAQYEAAYGSYTSAYQTYYTTKAQYDTAMRTYNALLENYFPDAQPNVAPEKQQPPLESYVNDYNTTLSNLQQDYELAQNSYSTEASKEKNLESEISSLKIQIAAASDSEETSVEGYKKQFQAAKEMILGDIDDEIEKYSEKIDNNTVKSTVSGSVTNLNIGVGSAVGEGTAILSLRKEGEEEDFVLCYVSWASAKKVTPGMDVKIYPTTADKNEYGNMIATVEAVDMTTSSESQVMADVMNESAAQMFLSNGPVIRIRCSLEKDPDSASGYKWSSKKGAQLEVPIGTLVTADIITEYKKPITMLIPYLKGLFDDAMSKKEN